MYLFELKAHHKKLKDLSADIQQILRGSNADKHQVVRFYTVRRHPPAVERLEWKQTKDGEIFQKVPWSGSVECRSFFPLFTAF